MGEVWWICCYGATDGTEKRCRIFCHGGANGTEKGCPIFFRGGTDRAEEYEAQDLSSLNVGCVGGIHGTWWMCFLPRVCREEMEKSFCCLALFSFVEGGGADISVCFGRNRPSL